MLIDTHCHFYLDDFKNDRQAIIENAEKQGVAAFYMPAIDSSTHRQMLEVEEAFKGKAFSMMGLHPCSVKENYKNELDLIKDYLEKQPFIAIGETGLDFYWDKTFTSEQYDAFQQQIEWGLQYNLPVVIHSRNSTDECIEIITQNRKSNLKGVFHCFSGNTEQANKITDLGFYLGIGGVLTFKNSGLDKVVEQINIEHLILETDAPYLAPVPFRGKRNESSYLKYIAGKLAALKQISIDEAAAITTANAQKLFGR